MTTLRGDWRGAAMGAWRALGQLVPTAQGVSSRGSWVDQAREGGVKGQA